MNKKTAPVLKQFQKSFGAGRRKPSKGVLGKFQSSFYPLSLKRKS